MTHKERMLKAARGEWADQLPWGPRIDLWHNSNSLRGTLPHPFRQGATLDEIADFIGGGYHKVVPEFLKVRTPRTTLTGDWGSTVCGEWRTDRSSWGSKGRWEGRRSDPRDLSYPGGIGLL